VRTNPSFALTDITQVRALIQANPFVTIVSNTTAGLVASHYPVLVDDDAEQLTLLGHVGRPDENLHELGQHEVLVIVQGEHSYISPGWYGDRSVPNVPTWNFTVAHLSGTPQILSADENYRTLGRLVDFFEEPMAQPRLMEGSVVDAAYARKLSSGTVGFRLPVTRFVAKSKLSQNKPAEVVDSVIAALDSDGAYANPELAQQMRQRKPPTTDAP
jgi:transcriptional regulator